MSRIEQMKSMQELSDKLDNLRRKRVEVQTEINATQVEYDRTKATLERYMNSKDPLVTDHAVLRYLERVHGLDMSKVREEILSPQLEAAIRFTQTGRFKSDGLVYAFKDYALQTIYKDE